MALYVPGSFGMDRLYVEEYETPPLSGLFFGAFILFAYLFICSRLVLKGLSRGRSKVGQEQLRWILWGFLASWSVHTVHSVDHNLRPVENRESRLAYQKYLFAEMEVPFLISVIGTLVAYLATSDILTPGKRTRGLRALCCYSIFCFGAPLTHYSVDPPWEFSFFVNCHILADGILGVALVICVLKFWKIVREMDERAERRNSIEFKGIQNIGI